MMSFSPTLTKLKYQALWKQHFSTISSVRIPSYDKFKDHEATFEKFLSRIKGNRSKIKYILIAEGPPASGNYIYEDEDGRGSYMTAPINAFLGPASAKGLDADQRLDNLASLGVLILDLFPFAINLSDIRRKLVRRGVPLDFFGNHMNPYSICSRLRKIRSLYPKIIDLSVSPNTAFIAPPTISNYLGELADNGTICNGQHGLQIRRGSRRVANPMFFCVANSGRNPNAALIREALDLP